jgi:hypothetical protein
LERRLHVGLAVEGVLRLPVNIIDTNAGCGAQRPNILRNPISNPSINHKQPS